MSDDKKKPPGPIQRKVRLFLLIFAVLLVPMVMDQAEVSRETVQLAGRIAAGITIALVLYGLFAKVLKTIVIVLLALIGLMLAVSEGVIKAPRLHEWWASKSENK